MQQQLAFCTMPDGVRIAYATYGNESAPPLVFELHWMSQESIWAYPEGRAFFEDLARTSRLVTYDHRGIGASQRGAPRASEAQNAADLVALLDHLGIERAALFSHGWVPAAFAALHPDRADRIILWGPAARGGGYTSPQIAMIRDSWNMYTRVAATIICPDGPAEAIRWVSDATRASMTPAYLLGEESSGPDEVVDYLSQVRCPALIFHRKRDQNTTDEDVKKVTALIPQARLVSLPGSAHHPLWGRDDYMDTLRQFLGAAPQHATGTRVAGTAVILFADIVDSTALTERIGDAAFHAQSEGLHRAMREALTACGGRVVEGRVLGDGVMAVFDAAKDAIAAATACHGAAEAVSSGDSASALRLHVGIHAGDVIRDENDVHGGAVNIAARIAAASAPGETLVSDVVRALGRTSAGVGFEGRGEFALKGIEEPQRLFAVRAARAG